MKKIKKQQKKNASIKVIEPIDTRIAKAVYSAKKISERIFGYISYEIKFVKATYEGKTQRPAKITAIEKGIVGILIVDETSTFEKIGTILGLDVVNDKAEQTILRTAIEKLQGFNAIEGDDSCLALTDGGRAYAEKGERPDLYTKSFDIFIDTLHPTWLNIKNCLGDNVKKIDEIKTPCENLHLDLDVIKSYAECQAQDVHCPQNRYLLESATWENGHNASYQVYVCFVQNVATKEVRTFVYDEKIEGLNELIAEQINKDDKLKTELLSNCIRLECENDEETILLEGEAIETAIAEIPAELKDAEQQMIKEEENAVKTEEENLEEKNSFPLQKTTWKNRLHKKALYDSLSFEVELQKIFKEDDPDEIWLISPWIRKYAFLDNRGSLIENFLGDEKKRVFVAYSEPASNNDGKPMIDEEVEPGIKQLENQYPNFFCVQLPEFHLKNVIEVKGDQIILFSGSFNVLSFSVPEQQTHIRREEMALAHHTIAKKKYQDCLLEFAEIYAERIKEHIMTLDDSAALTYNDERLDYFLKIDNTEIHKIFLPIEELLEEKSLNSTKRELKQKLAKIGQEFVIASNMSGLSSKDKKRIKCELKNVEEEMNKNNIDDPSMQELLKNNLDLLEKIHEKTIFPTRKKDTYKPKYIAKTNKPIVEKKNLSINILDDIPEATEEGLALYIAKLSFAVINHEIKTDSLNTKLQQIIEDDELVSLLEMIGVSDSKTVENSFDLTLGIKGYLFKFVRLSKNKENFANKQKRAKRLLTWTNRDNIETIVKQLS